MGWDSGLCSPGVRLRKPLRKCWVTTCAGIAETRSLQTTYLHLEIGVGEQVPGRSVQGKLGVKDGSRDGTAEVKVE